MGGKQEEVQRLYKKIIRESKFQKGFFFNQHPLSLYSMVLKYTLTLKKDSLYLTQWGYTTI